MKDLLKNIKEINKEKDNQNWILILVTGDLFFFRRIIDRVFANKKFKVLYSYK